MTTTTETTVTRADLVADMIRDGLTAHQMATRLGIRPRVLRQWAGRNSIPLPVIDPRADRAQQLAAMTAEGLTVPQMATRLGIQQSALRRWAYARNITLPRVDDHDHDAERLTAIDPDRTPQEIADTLGIERTTLVKWARDNNITLPSAPEVRNRRRGKAVMAMVEQGMTRDQIADRLGLVLHTLEMWCTNNHIALPTPPAACRRCKTKEAAPGRHLCLGCRDRSERKARMKATSERLISAATVTHHAVAFRQWSPVPSLYGGISPNAVATWFVDCSGCRVTEPADDEGHARRLADEHNQGHR